MQCWSDNRRKEIHGGWREKVNEQHQNLQLQLPANRSSYFREMESTTTTIERQRPNNRARTIQETPSFSCFLSPFFLIHYTSEQCRFEVCFLSKRGKKSMHLACPVRFSTCQTCSLGFELHYSVFILIEIPLNAKQNLFWHLVASPSLQNTNWQSPFNFIYAESY